MAGLSTTKVPNLRTFPPPPARDAAATSQCDKERRRWALEPLEQEVAGSLRSLWVGRPPRPLRVKDEGEPGRASVPAAPARPAPAAHWLIGELSDRGQKE